MNTLKKISTLDAYLDLLRMQADDIRNSLERAEQEKALLDALAAESFLNFRFVTAFNAFKEAVKIRSRIRRATRALVNFESNTAAARYL